MKILFISKYPPMKDGVGDYTFELVNYLKKYCEVGVLTFKDGISNDNIYRFLDINKKIIFYDVQKYVKFLIDKEKYDIVHVQTASFTFPRNFYLFPLRLKLNLVSTIHEVLTLRQFHYLPFVFNLYLKSKILITLSKEIANFLMKNYKIKKDKIRVMRHGADIKTFSPKVNQDKFRKLYGLNDDFVIMIFGFVGRGKGHDILIRAFNRVSDKLGNAKLVIAGGYKDLEYLEYLKKLSNNKVIFTGYVPYELLPSCIASADIFILPYLGGFHPSGPLHRALAAGRAIIASNNPVFRETIIHGYNGILVNPTEQEIAHAILNLYQNKNLRKELGENARRFAEEYLDWDKIARQTVKIYEEILFD